MTASSPTPQMRVYRHAPPEGPAAAGLAGATVALGNFDGVHLGHAAVLKRAGDIARAAGKPCGVMTFEPHPREVFRPDDPPFRLTPSPLKLALLRDLGLDFALVLHFDRDLAALTAEEFVDRWLIQALGVGHVVVGHDFCFGRNRAGNATVLAEIGQRAGFAVTAVSAQIAGDGAAYSSTRIRDHLQSGEPEAAARLLGRPHRIEGHVLHGDKRGRTIGFPTANMQLGPTLRPKAGVYAVHVLVDGQLHKGVANLGTRPTVDGTDLRLETHIFDFTGDLYGKRIAVDLISYLRPEMKFPGIAALTEQIAADSTEARRRLGLAAPAARAVTP